VKAKVILFKASGKYYTEEEWEVPTEVPDYSSVRGNFMRRVIAPYDMRHSKDFRRLDGGAVLVVDQEPWGYPHLFPGETLGRTVAKLADAAQNLVSEGQEPNSVLQDFIRRLHLALRMQ